MITLLYILLAVILLWFISGAVIVFYHYKIEYRSVYSFWEGVILSILWSWFGCFIVIFNISEKLFFWKNKHK